MISQVAEQQGDADRYGVQQIKILDDEAVKQPVIYSSTGRKLLESAY